MNQFNQLAEEFIKELPREYIDHIISNESYILEFEKPVKKARFGHSGLTAARVTFIENKAIECRNLYYTSLLREALVKMTKQPKYKNIIHRS